MAGYYRSLSFGWERESVTEGAPYLVPPHTLDLRRLNLGLALGCRPYTTRRELSAGWSFCGGHEAELFRNRQL